MEDNLKYYLRSQNEVFRSSANTSQFGLNSLTLFSSKVWNILPNEIKNSATLNIYKEKIRNCEPKNFIFKLYLP